VGGSSCAVDAETVSRPGKARSRTAASWWSAALAHPTRPWPSPASQAFEPDIPELCRGPADPQVARYQSWEAPYPPSQARQFLRELQATHPDTPGEWFQFAVALRRTDRLIGDCAAHVRADDPRQAEIGFTLASEHQGRGYATEAVRRLLHYLLIERGKHRVSATCDDRNTRSAAVLERVGMRREGHLLESTWAKGEWTNDLLYAVLRREWPASR
jgi:RimJ/RimL family protein N-acetyltransferase